MLLGFRDDEARTCYSALLLASLMIQPGGVIEPPGFRNDAARKGFCFSRSPGLTRRLAPNVTLLLFKPPPPL